MLKNKKINFFVFVFIALLTTASSVLALRTGVSPLDSSISLISNLFAIKALNNPYLKEGFYRFLILLFTFTVTFRALQFVPLFNEEKTKGGRKTGGVVALVLALFGMIAMPSKLLMATGTTIGASISSLAILCIFWGLAYVGVAVLSSKEGEEHGWFKNAAGLVLILLLITIFTLLKADVGIDNNINSGRFGDRVYSVIMQSTEIMLVISLFVKLFKLVSGGVASWKNPASSLGQSIKNALTGSSSSGSSTISQVSGFDGVVSAVGSPPEVRLWWSANPAGEGITSYKIQRLKPGKTVTSYFAWQNITSQPRAYDQASPYVDRNGIVSGNSYTYQIRAEGPAKGEWNIAIIEPPRAPGAPDFSARLNEIETAINQAQAHRRSMNLAFVNLCQANRNHIFDPISYPAPTLTMLDAVLQQYSDAEQQLDNAQQVANGIMSDGDFARITVSQNMRFVNLGIRFGDSLTELHDNFNDRMTRFSNGTV